MGTDTVAASPSSCPMSPRSSARPSPRSPSDPEPLETNGARQEGLHARRSSAGAGSGNPDTVGGPDSPGSPRWRQPKTPRSPGGPQARPASPPPAAIAPAAGDKVRILAAHTCAEAAQHVTMNRPVCIGPDSGSFVGARRVVHALQSRCPKAWYGLERVGRVAVRVIDSSRLPLPP